MPVSLTNHGMDIRPYLLGIALVYTFTGLTSFESLYSLLSVLSISKVSTTFVELSSLVTDVDPLSLESLSTTPLSLKGGEDTSSFFSSSFAERENISQGIILGLILIVVGFLFKIAGAPFHNWAPDVYDDSPTNVTIWLTIMPKLSIILLLLELEMGISLNASQTLIAESSGSLANLFDSSISTMGLNIINGYTFTLNFGDEEPASDVLKNIFLLSSLLSLIIGTVVGLAQIRIKRLLAYSTVSHIGFLLLALAISTEQSTESLIFYLIQYTITNLNAFFILLAFGYIINSLISSTYINSDIKFIFNLKGQFLSNPILSLSLAVCLFVRHCVQLCFGNSISVHWSYMYTATELNQGESPRSNLASPIKEGAGLKQVYPITLPAVSSMVKAVLLKVYSLGASSNGLQFACNRLYKVNPRHEKGDWIMIYLQPGYTKSLNVEKEQPKEDAGHKMKTMGLPKVVHDYGNGRIVVPANSLMNLYCHSNKWRRGRKLGYFIRSYSNEADKISTVKSDVNSKLLKLAEWCKQHPNERITSPVYRLMYDTSLYEISYHKIKSKPGNMTPGIVPTTLDGMSLEVIEKIINSLKDESFQFSPGRRVQIPKKSGGSRPLTVAPPRDKLVQEVMRMILEVIFEPTFSDTSHGFRSGRSCHTALKAIKENFGVSTWYIEGDISKCFDSINHDKLMTIIEKKITDRRFTNLIRKSLKAGYFEFKVFSHSISGTPQGTIISPLLCNIFMKKLDQFVESLKNDFDIGLRAKPNPKWANLQYRKRVAISVKEKLTLQKGVEMMRLPSKDLFDDNFKRLLYVRYADDWIIGIRGNKADCTKVLGKVNEFLKKELSLTLSPEKTLITNASTDRALFLGTNIFRSQHQTFSKSRHGTSTNFLQRNGIEIRLEAPLNRVTQKLTSSGFFKDGIPLPRFLWLANDKDTIITLYNSVFRGIVNYYSFSMNLGKLSAWSYFILKTSCAKLLAAKFKLGTQSKVYKKFGKDLKGKDKIGFIQPDFNIKPWDFKSTNVDIIQSLYADTVSRASLRDLLCNLCGSNYRVEMHHVRHLKDLNPKISNLDALMAKRRRKQIPVCINCHLGYHNGNIKTTPIK